MVVVVAVDVWPAPIAGAAADILLGDEFAFTAHTARRAVQRGGDGLEAAGAVAGLSAHRDAVDACGAGQAGAGVAVRAGHAQRVDGRAGELQCSVDRLDFGELADQRCESFVDAVVVGLDVLERLPQKAVVAYRAGGADDVGGQRALSR